MPGSYLMLNAQMGLR